MTQVLTNVMGKILANGLLALRERANMPRLVNLDWSSEAAQKGQTIDVPVPVAQTAAAITPSSTPLSPTETTPTLRQISLDQWYGTNFFLTDKDLVEVDRNRHFLPMQASEAVRALANKLNTHVLSKYKSVYGYVGTAGTTPFATTGAAATDSRKIMNQQLAPLDGRRAVINFDAEANALALAVFSDVSQTADSGPKIEGQIGRKYGVDWYAEDAIPTHTAGTITTGLIAKAATVVAVGATSIVATTAASTGACALVEGDIILIAGQTQTYVLTAAATQASAASDVTLTIQPPLKVALAGSEAITVKATHVVNLVFTRDAFALAMRPLIQSTQDLELGNRIMSATDPVTGISLRLEVSRQRKQVVWEFDALWGAACIRPEFACRIAG